MSENAASENRSGPRPTILPNEEYFTCAEVAELLKINRYTVQRRFGNLPGVIDLGTPEKMHKRRQRLLRIPRSALNRFLAERRVR